MTPAKNLDIVFAIPAGFAHSQMTGANDAQIEADVHKMLDNERFSDVAVSVANGMSLWPVDVVCPPECAFLPLIELSLQCRAELSEFFDQDVQQFGQLVSPKVPEILQLADSKCVEPSALMVFELHSYQA